MASGSAIVSCMNTFSAFERQQQFIQPLLTTQPELFVADKLYTEDAALDRIGISGLSTDRPEGWLRLYPSDFIVEEVRADGHSAVSAGLDGRPAGDGTTLYADLIKVNVGTLDAIRQLNSALGLSEGKIGYAGIKDAQALTSQRIALPLVSYEMIQSLRLSGMFLTNFAYGKGSVGQGQLLGNRFTITVRTSAPVDESLLIEHVRAIKRAGFLNYYQTQRFGGIRLLAHHLGREILRGDYASCVRLFLTEPGPFDIPLVKNIRAQALDVYGDWRRMSACFADMPYTFQHELRLLESLAQRPDNYISALFAIKDQSQLWAYAYASWLFNLYLSEAQATGQSLPDKLPLLLSDRAEDRARYQSWLDRDGINDIPAALAPLKFLQLKSRPTPTRIYPTDIKLMVASIGVILHFTLDKGAYATTFLMNLFRLRQGLPIPESLDTSPCDSLSLLQLGSTAPALERLAPYATSVLDRQTVAPPPSI